MEVALLLSHFPVRASAGTVYYVYPGQSIQTAINNASSGDTIVVYPGVYAGPFALKTGVNIEGHETAFTFLSGTGSGSTIATANGVSAVISKFTFINASSGIQVTGSSSLIIRNNVFTLKTAGSTAVSVASSPTTTILNNTFYSNGTAVSRDSDISIVNNIFSSDTTAAISPLTPSTNTSYNVFFGPNDVSTGSNTDTADPLLVNPTGGDFHLQDGSPCINTGDETVGANYDGSVPPDIGAYGGPLPWADPIPFPVQGLTVLASTDTSIDLEWQPNLSYAIINGDYRLYYGYASQTYNGTDGFGGTGPSPISMGADFTTFSLTDLNPSALMPTVPVLNVPDPANPQVVLVWSPAVSGAPNAIGYKVYYQAGSPTVTVVDVGNTTTFTLPGISTGQVYRAAVSAYVQPTYYLAVTATDYTFKNESDLSTEVSVPMGPLLESGLSNQVGPGDTITVYPALPNSGKWCFIATAAYESDAAPEVIVLRAFRDRYLMKTVLGRLAVDWYYRHSPAAAALLNAHPSFKPAVRAALMPVVGAAFLLTETPSALLTCIALVAGTIIIFGIYRLARKRRTRAGGHP